MSEGPQILPSSLKSTTSQETEPPEVLFQGTSHSCLPVLGVCDHCDIIAHRLPLPPFCLLPLSVIPGDTVLGLIPAGQGGPTLSGVALAYWEQPERKMSWEELYCHREGMQGELQNVQPVDRELEKYRRSSSCLIWDWQGSLVAPVLCPQLGLELSIVQLLMHSRLCGQTAWVWILALLCLSYVTWCASVFSSVKWDNNSGSWKDCNEDWVNKGKFLRTVPATK